MSSVLEIGQQLQRRRLELNLTQEDLAGRAGVSRRWLIELEKGHYNAQLWKVLAVAEALGLDLITAPRPELPGPDELDDYVSGFTA